MAGGKQCYLKAGTKNERVIRVRRWQISLRCLLGHLDSCPVLSPQENKGQ